MKVSRLHYQRQAPQGKPHVAFPCPLTIGFPEEEQQYTQQGLAVAAQQILVKPGVGELETPAVPD